MTSLKEGEGGKAICDTRVLGLGHKGVTGGRGVNICPNLRDIIYECPLKNTMVMSLCMQRLKWGCGLLGERGNEALPVIMIKYLCKEVYPECAALARVNNLWRIQQYPVDNTYNTVLSGRGRMRGNLNRPLIFSNNQPNSFSHSNKV